MPAPHAAHDRNGAPLREHPAPASLAPAVVESAFTPHEARQARRLGLVLALVGGFFVLELAGAIVADSVVLQADAAHLLMDVLALGVSLFAMRLAVRRPTSRLTFGLRRVEPVAAIFSAVLVTMTTALIVVEGVEALRDHVPPKAAVMLVVAILALIVNGLSAWLLHDVIGHAHPHVHDPDNPDDAHEHADHDHQVHAPPRRRGHALNLRGAALHLLGDTLGALAALVAALVIHFGGPAQADPLASFVVAAILVVGSVRLLRDASLVLLEAAPVHLPVERVREIVAHFPGVVSLHDLHVWTLGAGHDAVTVHVHTATADPMLGERLSEHLRGATGAEYVTVQVETGAGSCVALREARPDGGKDAEAGPTLRT